MIQRPVDILRQHLGQGRARRTSVRAGATLRPLPERLGQSVRALARVSGVDEPTIAHRLMGAWEPTPEFFALLLAGGALIASSRTRRSRT